jgi:signal transduction histidine kinase
MRQRAWGAKRATGDICDAVRPSNAGSGSWREEAARMPIPYVPDASSRRDQRNSGASDSQIFSVPGSESLAEVAHDARNMVAALGLYCELLEQPGVLADSFTHYSRELRQVASASRHLVEKLAQIETPLAPKCAATSAIDTGNASWWRAKLPGSGPRDIVRRGWDYQFPAAPVANLAAELLSMRNLLGAIAGPGIAVTVEAHGGARPARVTGEDLTRVLVNLVKNAVEAMPGAGRIHIGLQEQNGENGDWLALTVEDTGPGIPEVLLNRIFETGYTGHSPHNGRPRSHRGLGLAITRAIVENASGRIRAENRISGGARIVMEFPAGR